MNVLRVEIIAFVKVVVVSDERHTEHEVLSKRQYLHIQTLGVVGVEEETHSDRLR